MGIRVLILIVCAAWNSALLRAAEETIASPRNAFSIHDMLAMERISDVNVAPAGDQFVMSLRRTDLEANRGRTDLWLVSIDGQWERRLTANSATDYNPRWAPNGERIYFLSTRSGSSQVWQIAVNGGEAEQLTDLPLDVTSFAVAPNGESLALSMDVFPELSVDETKQELDAREAHPATGMLYDQLFIRHWDTWKDGRRSHLFVLSLATGSLTDVMAGMNADCPTKPFGGPEDYTYAPDSNSLVFAARNVGRREAWSTDFDLYRTPCDGSATPKSLTSTNPAWDASPVFSPDGQWLAYLAMQRAGYEADRYVVMLRSWPDGETKAVTPDWDRSPSGLSFSADSQSLYANANHLGQRSLFRINLQDSSVTTLIGQGTVRSFAEVGDQILFTMDHLQSPVEVYRCSLDGSNTTPVTRRNEKQLAEVRLGEAEQFTFAGWNDETVYCYVVKPADFDPNKKYPVAFLIHGGPQGSFGNDFHYRWNPQAYTGAGYAAVMVDFHGSVGYGQDFTDSIGGDWGGKPLEDLQKGLAAALERYPWMDGDHVSALGASYGGYMINWIAGQWPDRFRCLINHDGNLDERMAYFDTEELWFPEWERSGAPWENPEAYSKHNPIDYVDRWQTPMLVIHGALDYRVVDTQGISTFTALQRRGIPSQFLYFPDENHWVLKPQNSIQWHDTVIRWLDRWTKGSDETVEEEHSGPDHSGHDHEGHDHD